MKKNKRSAAALIATITIAALALAACGGGGQSSSSPAAGGSPTSQGSTPPAGGTQQAAAPQGAPQQAAAQQAPAQLPLPAVTLAVPYTLPAHGEAVAIGSNVAGSVRPAQINAFDWSYSLFQSFGAGTFVPDFSAGGAFVVAGSGGHNAPPVLDAVAFDFADATWKRIPNANGIVQRSADYDVAETTGAPFYELRGATAGQVPAPSHLYGLTIHLPAGPVGGPRGGYLKMGSSAATLQSYPGSGIHKMDLSTGLWSRVTNDTLDFGTNYEATTVFDPQTSRYYFIPDGFHAFDSLQYFDLADQRIKRTPSYPWPDTPADAQYQTTFLDPVRRLIVVQRPGNPLRALDLNDFASGWRTLNSSGTQPPQANRWVFYPEDGRFYTRTNNSGQTLYRMTPPQDWRTGTWVIDTVTVTGAPLPDFTATAGGGVRHYGTFFYVQAIKSLAWISGDSTQVLIMRPPAAAPVPAPLLPTVSLTSGASGTALPFSFGQVFRKGAIPAGRSAVVAGVPSQVTPLSTWDDGSVKHALVAGRADFSAGAARTFAFALGSAAAGALAESDLIAAGPQATVSYGSYGSVSLAALLGTSALVLTEHAGPEYAAFQYIAPFPNEASLRAVFYVQLYAGGNYRVRVAVENGTSQVSSSSKSGTAAVSVAGTARFSGAVAMPEGTRWDAVGATAPAITVAHDAAYLRASRLVPNYGYTQPSAQRLSALLTAYTPMSRLGWEQDMGATGYAEGIGLLPHWDALYATSADARALASSVAHSSALGSYTIFYRNPATRRIQKFSDFPTAYANDESLQRGGSPNRWEVAHHPHAGYLAWLATAERFHLETMQANAFAAWYTDSGGGQSGTDKLYVSQTRAKAWRYRTIASLAAVAPDAEPFKADAKASVLANLRSWKASWVDTNAPATGLGATYGDQESGVPGQQMALFEHFFLAASVGWSWDQELGLDAAGKATLAAVRDYFYRVPIGASGRGQEAGEYCYRRAVGPYRTTVGGTPDTFYATWGQVYAATYTDGASCAAGLALQESYIDSSPAAFAQGNWGHLITALSYAADHGVAGAAEAYGRITGASNWPSNAVNFNDWPQYGVLKR
jgi:hypothetical protein